MDYENLPGSKFHINFNDKYKEFHLKMLADVMESIIGAIFLDCLSSEEGVNEAERVWTEFIFPDVECFCKI